MMTRSLRFAATLAVVAGGAAGCSSDTPSPVGTQTVRLAVVADGNHGGHPFSTAMTQEVTSTPAYAGDVDGTGTALLSVNRGQREVCWELSVADVRLPATAAHIHRAPTGVRGGIVVYLSAPDATGHASGCASEVDRDLLLDILTHPAGYYVNVHNADYPAGAVRGQLGH